MQAKLSDSVPVILSYDAQVLECFFDEGGSKRTHISHIRSIRLEPQKAGKYLLTIQLKRDQMLLWVDEKYLPSVNQLLADVQNGITKPGSD